MTFEPNGRSAEVAILLKKPDALMGLSLNLKTTQAYDPASSKPSGATKSIVYVTPVPIPSSSTDLKEFLPIFRKSIRFQRVLDHNLYIDSQVSFL